MHCTTLPDSYYRIIDIIAVQCPLYHLLAVGWSVISGPLASQHWGPWHLLIQAPGPLASPYWGPWAPWHLSIDHCDRCQSGGQGDMSLLDSLILMDSLLSLIYNRSSHIGITVFPVDAFKHPKQIISQQCKKSKILKICKTKNIKYYSIPLY